jgi:anti-sigma B factor antagonist
MPSEQFAVGPPWNGDEILSALAEWDRLSTTAERRDGVSVVHVVGEIEFATAGRLAAVLAHELACGAVDILLDLHDVTFIDCGGVGVLVDATHSAAERGVRLRIVPGPALHRLSEILGLAGELDLGDRSR